MKVSVVISSYNEEKKIEECLKSVEGIAEEIIFVDNTSTDRTVEIAKKYTDKIFIRENNPMLNVNKNFGFTKATSEWILSLDSDERVTSKLADEILSLDEKAVADGYRIPRENIIFGKWIKNSIWWPDYQLRLFRNQKGRFEEKHVHEYIKVDGQVGILENPLKHLNYETISQYLYKLDNIYTQSEVNAIIESGKKLQWYDALRMPFHDFLKNYFFQKGYRDGLHGLVLGLLQAFYMVVVFAKVWEKQGFEEKNIALNEIVGEMKNLGSELTYWTLTARINEKKSFPKKILLKLRRRAIRTRS